MKVSIVVPAYNASSTVSDTLSSIFAGSKADMDAVEVVVVDDGSDDVEELRRICTAFRGLKLVRHKKNLGMCAARNTGITESTGDFVIILDADDLLVADWRLRLKSLVAHMPNAVNVCFASCVNAEGRATSSNPSYEGFLNFQDLLLERNSGEYLPIFRGTYIRSRLYVDIGLRKSCGILSYLSFAKDGPFWISRSVLRIYNDSREGSVSHAWMSQEKAMEAVTCNETLLERFGDDYRSLALHTYHTKWLRLAVYRRLAGASGFWRAWLTGASFGSLKETIGAFVVLAVGPACGRVFVSLAKEIGLIRRYG